jgi:predicted nucleotidyltransferase
MALAESLTAQIRKVPEAEVVLGMGSLARGFGDRWSDLDLAVLGHGLDAGPFWRGERYLAGVSVDLFVVDLASVPPSRWDVGRREAFEESVVLFRRDPALLRGLRRRLRLGRRERLERIRDLLFRLGWLGFAPREWYGKRKYGYHWELPPDVWVQRGSVSSAHGTVDQAYDMALQMLYLLNGRHVPDPKWRRFRAAGLAWSPEGFAGLRDQVEGGARDEPAYARRAEATVALVEGMVRHLEDRGEIEGDWYAAYLDSCPDYNPVRVD